MRLGIFTLRSLVLAALVSAFLISTAAGQDEPIAINTDLVQTDVTVVDKDGRFVNGLKPDQFELRIDGKPTKIDFFEQINSSFTKASPGTGQDTQNDVSGTGLSLRQRKIIFFIDDIHLSLDSLGRTRSAIRHFIDTDMMPRDIAAIITSSGQLGFLQQFTDNKAVLHAAVEKLRAVPNSTRDTEQPPMSEYIAVRILNNDTQAMEFYVDKIKEGYNTKKYQAVNENAIMETVKSRANGIVSIMAESSKVTLRSLENLMALINQTSGRKLIFLMSDGFYLESKNTPYSTNNDLQRVINLAARSNSSVYTIDARGLFSLSGSDATNERPADTKGRLDRAAIGESQASQEGLDTLAGQTGGRFLKNQNYFEKWVDRMLDENANYYVLAWTPDKAEQTNKKFKKIEVGVIGQLDLKVRMQRGYLTSWDRPDSKGDGKGKENANKNADGITPIDPVKSSAAKKILPVELLLSYLDIPNVGGVLSSSVQIGANELKYGDKGDQAAKLYIEGTVFNSEGKQVAGFKNGVTLNPAPAGTDASTRQSVIYGEKTPLAPGVYQVRARVGEIQTGNSGTATQWVEIPDLSKRSLTLGSIFLGGKLIETAGKEGTTAAQFQFSVDHRFGRPVTLDFMSFIYNAGRANGNGDTNLETRIEVLDMNGKAVVDTAMRPLSTKGNPDMARIPLRGSIKQNLGTPGSYLLRITVKDGIAGTTTTREAIFTVE